MTKVSKLNARQMMPVKIAGLLGEPELWRGESVEDFNTLLLEIGSAVGATDIVAWISVSHVTCHIFEYRRLKKISRAMIRDKQIEIIEELLKTTCDASGPEQDVAYYISGAKNDARRWATDPIFAKTIDDRLAARGHDQASIVAKAYLLCGPAVRALDDVMAKLELRQMATLREIERRDEMLARRLEKTSQQFIEGEFSEAAE